MWYQSRRGGRGLASGTSIPVCPDTGLAQQGSQSPRSYSCRPGPVDAGEGWEGDQRLHSSRPAGTPLGGPRPPLGGSEHPLPLSPALRPGHHQISTPGAFQSGLPASPAGPQPSGLLLPSPQCGGDSLTLREGRCWPTEGCGSCLGAAPPIRAEWGLRTQASPGKVLLWTGEQRESCGRERQGLQLPRAFLPSIAGPGSFGNGRFKNKTRAGCASLLAHFAAFQLKGESKAWLFITNPDLACSSWGGVAVVVHRPQRNPSEKPIRTPGSLRPSGGVGVSRMDRWGSEKSWPEGGALGRWGGQGESQQNRRPPGADPHR